MTARLEDIVETLMLGPVDASPAVAVGDRGAALLALASLVRQAPARHLDRVRFLSMVDDGLSEASTSEILNVSSGLRTGAPRFPAATAPVRLPLLDPVLAETFEVLFGLEADVAEPWTLIGGLMVMLHCAEHGVPFVRVTADADVAIGVFTHRAALRHLTRALGRFGFADVTPAPMASDGLMSYRWSRGKVLVDVAVPPRVNDQRHVPRTTTLRPAVELPAVQQAIARSERLQVSIDDGPAGFVRRPDLLGSLVIKAQAATSDRRDPDRHRTDMVALCEALAMSGAHVRYRDQLRSKDRRRLVSAADTIRPAQWRLASDPEAARGALRSLLGD